MGSGVAEMMHLRWFWQHLPKDGSVQLCSETQNLHGFQLAGPKARAVLESLTDHDISAQAFGFFSCARMDIANVALDVARLSFTGELGYELYVPASFQRAIYLALLEAGQAQGLCHFGTRALNSLRLEKGFGSWGRDYTSDYTPLEAKLDWAIDPNKEHFLGRESYQQAKRLRPTQNQPEQNRPAQKQLALFEVDLPQTGEDCADA